MILTFEQSIDIQTVQLNSNEDANATLEKDSEDYKSIKEDFKKELQSKFVQKQDSLFFDNTGYGPSKADIQELVGSCLKF